MERKNYKFVEKTYKGINVRRFCSLWNIPNEGDNAGWNRVIKHRLLHRKWE